jgi:hypothetical protein
MIPLEDVVLKMMPTQAGMEMMQILQGLFFLLQETNMSSRTRSG